MEIKTEKIWSDYHRKLKGFVLSKVKDEDVCNDILQDAFMKIHLNLATLENKDRLEQWIYQITRNLINDHFRKTKPSVNADKIDLPEEINEPSGVSVFAKCLTSFIKTLPEKYKEALTLVEFNKLDQLQLAKRLDISYSGAKSRVQRARELLKEQFSKCCNVTADKYGNIVSAKSTCSTCHI